MNSSISWSYSARSSALGFFESALISSKVMNNERAAFLSQLLNDAASCMAMSSTFSSFAFAGAGSELAGDEVAPGPVGAVAGGGASDAHAARATAKRAASN